ncbi:hypothetical protein [Vibrio cholerae]|uniref:hypothetical protein n=1 Tax=Vibrio cholerae TaxID=666 RepID=UPI00084225BF|nr:hypothetical protein [Vibrio cholerae]GHW66644.1 lipopolysaccharide biosynthesis protein [Vibrio cholerae]HDZ9289795.1 hypothetical protein [Vibrio cholerae]
MKILFICPNWAGLAVPIVNEMVKQGHDVTHLDHNDFSSFKYLNRSHRVLSKMYQFLTKESYKHRMTDLEITRTIDSFFIKRDNFDVILMTEPSLFNRHHINQLKLHCKSLSVALWDSLTKSKDNNVNLDLFDIVFSYDSEDCHQYGFHKINNYIDPSWTTDVSINDAKYDVFSIMSFTKERYKNVVSFLNANPSILSNIFFYIDNEKKRKYIKDTRVKVINKLMLGDELKDNIENSKSILDFLQGHQAGLSFRVYESLGYKRKLITTNAYIKEYDIYNESNIFVLNKGCYKIPNDFICSHYIEVPEQKIKKYLISSWVDNILGKVTIH